LHDDKNQITSAARPELVAGRTDNSHPRRDNIFTIFDDRSRAIRQPFADPACIGGEGVLL